MVIVVFRFHVQPGSNLEELDTLNQKMGALVSKIVRSRNINMVNFFTLRRDDFTYYYVAQVDDPAHPDPQNKFWVDLQAELGEKATAKLSGGFDGLVESSKASYLHRPFDLSYDPENASLSGDPMLLTHTDWYYFDPGSFDEAKALAKEFKALWKKNKVERSYRLYFGGVGTERPMFLVAQNAKSVGDYYSYVDERNASIGEEPLSSLLNRLADSGEVNYQNESQYQETEGYEDENTPADQDDDDSENYDDTNGSDYDDSGEAEDGEKANEF